MNSTEKKVVLVLTVVTVVGIVIMYKRLKKQDETRRNEMKEDKKGETLTDLNRLRDKYKRSLKEIELQDQRDEEERNAEVLRKMGRNNYMMEKKDSETERLDGDNELKFSKMKAENERRLQNLKDQKRMENLVKDKMAKFETEQLRSRAKLKVEQIRLETKRSREVHLGNVSRLDDLFQNQKKKMTEEKFERQQEIRQEEERAQHRRHEMEVQMERDLEDLRRRSQKRRNELDEQFIQIQKILQLKLWNEVIERNWMNRLNTLRSSFEDVRNAYTQMTRYQNQEPRILLTAIDNQKYLMNNEKKEMEKLYKQFGKLFLLDIKHAVGNVSAECDRLIYVLKNEQSNFRRIEDCFSALSRNSMAIPTLAELKKRYEENMR